jgi:hypothetical protein
MTKNEIKKLIWALTKDLALINKAKAAYKNDDTNDYWQRVYEYLQIALPPKSAKKAKRKSGLRLTEDQKKRYLQAHNDWYKHKYPNAYKDGHYIEPLQVDIGTSNGLQSFIVNYLDWTGCYGNRINTMGRQIGGKWIKSSTKKGTGDIMAIIKGMSVTFEVKIGKDKASEHQLKQQSRIKQAGGRYFFIKTVEDFFTQLDLILEK